MRRLTSKSPRWKLTTVLLIPVVTLVVVTLIVLTVVSNTVSSRQEEAMLEQRATSVLEGIQVRLQDRQRTKEVFATMLADVPDLAASVVEHDEGSITRILVPLRAQLGLGFIEVYSHEGEPLAFLGPGEARDTDDALVKSALSGLTRSVSQAGEEGLDVLAIAPIKDASGVVGAIVAGAILTDEALLGVSDPSALGLAVFRDGTLVSTTVTEPDFLTEFASSGARTQTVAELHRAVQSLGFRAASQPLDSDGLLVALISDADVEQVAQERARVAIIGAGALILALVIGALALGRAVSQPLKATVEACRKMANGEYDRRVPKGWIWEVNELGTGINTLAERVESQMARMSHMALHDELTNLPNRTLFKDRLNVALAQARRSEAKTTVMFLDLDQFKLVNDTVGHAMGDQLLKSAAERLVGLVREGDTVARVGGDEFTMILPDISGVEVTCEVAERILEALRKPWELAGLEFRVTGSIGVATYPSDGEDAETLLRNADIAMYRAKEGGRDQFQVFSAAMNAYVLRRVSLESDLRRALEQGEFVLHYQPQVNIDTGQIVGIEALVRWQPPEGGLVYPNDFIPLAEDTALIVPLGEWVLRTACRQSKAWQEASLPSVRIAVNLSGRQFQQPDLVDMITSVLKETGLDPQWLELEITEGTAMQDVDYTIKILDELRAIGVHISIDDFGTGYSSLGYLKRFSIDEVKVDRSFVRDITAGPDDAAIVGAIISLADSLHLRVVAEGVETEEQLVFLRERQCHQAQGYLFSKPVPADVLGRLLAQRQPLRVSSSRMKSGQSG